MTMDICMLAVDDDSDVGRLFARQFGREIRSDILDHRFRDSGEATHAALAGRGK